MFREIVLDRLDPGGRPVLEPGLREVVLNYVKYAAHVHMP
jgi:hypothetical protein